MRAVLTAHRHSSLLVAVLLAQLFFLAYQIKTSDNVSLLRVWVVAALAPAEKGLHSLVDGGATFYEDYLALRGVRQENRALQKELEEARLQLQQLSAGARESERLQALLDLKQANPTAPLLAARVIGANPAGASRTVRIDRGEDDGLQPNMIVLTPDGVVGKIIAVAGGSAEVQLVTDSKSGVGVEVVDTALLGVVIGHGDSTCRLEYVPNEETVSEGAELVTSGQDQLFPRGLRVGRIVTARPDKPFQEIVVEPAARLSRLDHVLVLAGPPGSWTTTAQAGASRTGVSR